MFKTLIAALIGTGGALLMLTQSAHASGNQSEDWASLQGECRAAQKQAAAIASNTRCSIRVHYFNEDCKFRSSFNGCLTDLAANRLVTYWIERRKNSLQPWKQFTTTRIYDFNGIDERVDINPAATYEYRVAFDRLGQKAFGDEFTPTFKVFVKGR